MNNRWIENIRSLRGVVNVNESGVEGERRRQPRRYLFPSPCGCTARNENRTRKNTSRNRNPRRERAERREDECRVRTVFVLVHGARLREALRVVALHLLLLALAHLLRVRRRSRRARRVHATHAA